jgi:DNA-binding transcriptional LysR family regulator
MERLETRDLEYFVAVAEELHFGRAAERLGMAQPPLSRAIARLERRMGVRLFERTSRSVELTAAGEVFLAETRKALAAADAAVRRARQAADPARLVVAARAGTGSGLLADLLKAYARRPGAVPVEMLFTADHAAALHDGTADLGVLCDDDLEGLETTELAQEDPVALLPVGHALTSRAAVTVAELRGMEGFAEQCPPSAVGEILELVAMGRLVTIVGDSLTDRLGSAVAAVPVTDLPRTRIVLAWPRHTESPVRDGFVQAAKSRPQSSLWPPSARSSTPVT